MVHRSPFFTQSVPVTRSRRSLAAGDHQIPDAGLVAVGAARRSRVACCRSVCGVVVSRWVRARWLSSAASSRVGASMSASSPLAAVGLPGGEQVLGEGGLVADVDAVLVEVEAERFGSAVAEGEGGGGFGRIGEPEEFGEPDRAVLVWMSRRTPPAPIAASCWSSPTSRTLPPRPTMNWTAVSRVRVSAIPASSITTNVDGPIRDAQLGQIVVVDGPGEFGEGVGVAADLVAELRRGGGGGGEPDHLTAAAGPGGGQGVEGGGFPGAGRRDRQLQPGPGGGHGSHQPDLPGVQRDAVGDHLQQRHIDRRLVDGPPVGAAGACEEALFGGQDPGRGEQVGAGDGVDAGPIRAAQQRRFGDPVGRVGPGDTDRWWSTSSTSRSTSSSARPPGTSAARTWRCASARTCQTCQVARRSSTAASTRSAARSSHAASTRGPLVGRWPSARETMSRTRSGPPSTSTAWCVPGVALLGQAAGFVFGVAGLQGGLLRQLQRLRPGWVAGRGGAGTRPRAHPAGHRCGPVGSTSAGSVRGRRRRSPAPAASADPGWAVRRTGRRGCRGGGFPGRCCRFPTRPRWP